MFKVICCFLMSFLFLTDLYAEEILTWGDCLTEARKNNPQLISSAEGINQQQASKTITASGLFPQIDFNVDAARSKKTTTGNSYSYGVSGSQLLFDGLKTSNDVKAAGENVAAARQAYLFTSSEIRFNLRGAFIDLLRVQELIGVAQDIQRIRKNNLVLITLRYESGLEHRGALLTAQANMDQANFEFSQAQRNGNLAQRQLSKEMGRPEFRAFKVSGNFMVSPAPAQEKPDFEAIVKNNPSVLQAVARKNATSYGVRSAYGKFAPQISGSAGADKASSHWPPDQDQWNLGVTLTLPLFEGGLRTAQVSQAQALYRQAQADERNVRDTAVVALEQTWSGLRDAQDIVMVQDSSLKAAEERSKIAEAQYSTGFISFDNWIIIENDLVNAKKAYLEAQANALVAEAAWIQAKGETLEYAQ